MNPGRILKLLTMLLVASTPAMAQQKPPTEAQCRDVVNGMLQAMKSAQMKSERDKQGAQVVIGCDREPGHQPVSPPGLRH